MLLRTLALALLLSCGLVQAQTPARKPAKTKVVKPKAVKPKAFKPEKFKPKAVKIKKDKRFQESKVVKVKPRKPVKH